MTWAYAAIMLSAVLSAVLLSRRKQGRLGLTPGQRWGLAMGAFIGAMLGAKLPFLFTDSDSFLTGRVWLENGKTLIFGLAGGYLGVEVAKWRMGIVVKTGDSFAVPVAVAVGIGRMSCLVAGCCYGLPTTLPWGLDLGDGFRRHPVPIYEMLFHLSAALVLEWLYRHGRLRGQLIKLYILAYLVFRFATEFLRPEPAWGLGLTFYQWSCLLLIPVFVGLWIRDSRSSGMPGQKSPSPRRQELWHRARLMGKS